MFVLIKGEFTPWSFELFALGLDIILPKMSEDSFKVLSLVVHLSIDSSTNDSFLNFTTTNV